MYAIPVIGIFALLIGCALLVIGIWRLKATNNKKWWFMIGPAIALLALALALAIWMVVIAITSHTPATPPTGPSAAPISAPAAIGFPTDLASASQILGVPQDSLEFTAECCGVHVIEDHDRTTINIPSSAVGEGYWDLEPGKSPAVQIVVGSAIVRWQGGTVWWSKIDETTLTMACFLWNFHSTNHTVVSQGAVNFDPNTCP